ncbi:MAG: hypothetical protein H6631_13435 [Anaerolineaceae bacterium]|nr:hypothetical protein [Anaerolineaceae bacterium]MCB9101218.1 hypothetical protein [Anaerolineales bacterium]
MEDFPQEPSSAYDHQPATPPTVSPVYFGTALAIAFAIGLFIGLTGRPLVIRDVPVQVVVTVVPNPNGEAVAQAPAAAAESAGGSGANQTAVDQSAQASADGTATPTLMEYVMSDARHIQGDANAPVTVVEYSDFK